MSDVLNTLKKRLSTDASDDVDDTREAILQHFNSDNPMGSTIKKTFRCMSVAERMIEEAQDEHPDKADRIDDAFKVLKPSLPLVDAPMKVYEHHVSIMLARVKYPETHEPIDTPTDAEVLAVLLNMLNRVPLNRAAREAIVYLASPLVPDDLAADMDAIRSTSCADNKQALDLITEVKDRLADDVAPRDAS